jgi:hypothetical protein
MSDAALPADSGGMDEPVVCLRCGKQRDDCDAECPRCGYVGWAPAARLDEHERRLLAFRRLRPALSVKPKV